MLCRELKGEQRKRELRSLWPRLSKSRRTRKQREFKSNSVHSNKELTKQLQKPQAHAHSTAARTSYTITALHKAGAPAEHLEQARQAAFTLINGLQGLCTAAGAVTVADEPEDPMIDFDGSDEEFRQMLSKASQDEEIDRQVGKKTIDLQTLANRE